jgi:UDP-3-O-[3-hydroxymyristoyl] glucosamine N-acyltransferase
VALRLGQIVESLGGRLIGDPQHIIQKLAPLDTAQADALSFLSNPKYQSQLATTLAGCVIVSPAVAETAKVSSALIVADNPYHYFARLTQLWRQHTRVNDEPLVHPSARIGPLCVIERGAHIGANTWLKSGITVGEDCRIGERCIVHAGVVIGADGFGFALFEGRWEKIEQLGAVRIGNDVEIGANTCIDRGALDDTIIEDGVKLDNLVQIGHNVHVGPNTAMAGCAGVAGSARIGANCIVGGGAIVLGHLELADGVHISAASVVMRSIRQPGQYSGVFPIDDNASWEKNAATLRQLHRLRDRIKSLESVLESQKK